MGTDKTLCKGSEWIYNTIAKTSVQHMEKYASRKKGLNNKLKYNSSCATTLYLP